MMVFEPHIIESSIENRKSSLSEDSAGDIQDICLSKENNLDSIIETRKPFVKLVSGKKYNEKSKELALGSTFSKMPTESCMNNVNMKPYVSITCGNMRLCDTASLLKFSGSLSEVIMNDVLQCIQSVKVTNKAKGLCGFQTNCPPNGVCVSSLRDRSPTCQDGASVKGSESDDMSLCDTFLESVFKESDIETPKSAGGPKVTKSKRLSKKERKRKKLLRKLTPVEPPCTFAERGFLTTTRTDTDASEALGCPVCFEVFFNPYSCVPCNHVYCEPCLRRMAKYNTDRKRPHRCPICRIVIARCSFNQDIHEKVLTHLPDEYQRRGKSESSNRYMSHPLPFTPKMPDIKTITSAISERQRQQAESYWRMVLTTAIFFTCKGLVILGLVWFFSLFSEDGFVSNTWDYLWEQVYQYNSLDVHRKADITNHVFVVLLGLILFSSIYCSNARNGIQNRRL